MLESSVGTHLLRVEVQSGVDFDGYMEKLRGMRHHLPECTHPDRTFQMEDWVVGNLRRCEAVQASLPRTFTEMFDVVGLMPKDLGFESRASYGEICQAAQNAGFNLFEPGDAFPVRLAWWNQVGSARLAMKPIKTFSVDAEAEYIFSLAVVNYCKYMIALIQCSDEDIFHPETLFAFRLPA